MADINQVEQPPLATPPPITYPKKSRPVAKRDRGAWFKRQAVSGAAILKFFEQKGLHAQTLNFSRQKGKLAHALNGRWTTLAIAVLTLVALVLLASWYGLRANSSAAGVRDSVGVKSAASKADTNERAAKNQSASLPAASGNSALPSTSPTSLNPSSILSGDVSGNSAERKFAGSRSLDQIKTLPQNAISSKLRPASAGSVEAAAPATMSLAKASGDLIPSLAAAHVAAPAPPWINGPCWIR